MKTKKLLVMMNFVDVYRELIEEAYHNYEDFSLADDEKDKAFLALNALIYATRANTVYDSAFYAELRGLPSNLSDIEKREAERNGYCRMDDIVSDTKSYLQDTIMELFATLEIKGDKELCDVIKSTDENTELYDEKDLKW